MLGISFGVTTAVSAADLGHTWKDIILLDIGRPATVVTLMVLAKIGAMNSPRLADAATASVAGGTERNTGSASAEDVTLGTSSSNDTVPPAKPIKSSLSGESLVETGTASKRPKRNPP